MGKIKYSKEQIKMLKQAGFDDEDIKFFEQNPSYAPTSEELADLTSVNEIEQTLDLLPEEVSEVRRRFEEEFGPILANGNASKKDIDDKIMELSEKDPKLLQQIMAMNMLSELAGEEEKKEKTLDDLIAENDDPIFASILNKIKNS